jgi:hypothetical protein
MSLSKKAFMKNILRFLFLMVTITGCSDEDPQPIPVTDQISFELDSQQVNCSDGFYWNGTSFSGHFHHGAIKDGMMQIESSHITQVGTYVMDPAIPNSNDVLTVWSDGVATFSTFQGALSSLQGSGRLTIEAVTGHFIKGNFEGTLITWHGTAVHITNGQFQVNLD